MIIIAFITLLNVSSNTSSLFYNPASDIIKKAAAFIIEFIRRTNSLFLIACFISQMCSYFPPNLRGKEEN